MSEQLQDGLTWILLLVLGGGGATTLLIKMLDWRLSRATTTNVEAQSQKTMQETVTEAVGALSEVLEHVRTDRADAVSQVDALKEDRAAMKAEYDQRIISVETRLQGVEHRETAMLSFLAKHREEWDIPTWKLALQVDPEWPAPGIFIYQPPPPPP